MFCTVNFLAWLCRHNDIKGNEHADKLAEEVAQEAKETEQFQQ